MASQVPAPAPVEASAARAPASPRRAAAFRAGGLAALAIAAWDVAHAVTLPSFSMCAFKLMTDRPCPGCGMTRAVFRLAEGDLAGSLRYHPLALPVASVAAAVLVGGVAGALTGRDPVWPAVSKRGGLLATAFVASMLAIWVVRAWIVPSWSPDSPETSAYVEAAAGDAGR